MSELKDFSVRAFVTFEVDVVIPARDHKEAEELVGGMSLDDLLNFYVEDEDIQVHGLESVELE